MPRQTTTTKYKVGDLLHDLKHDEIGLITGFDLALGEEIMITEWISKECSYEWIRLIDIDFSIDINELQHYPRKDEQS